MTSRHERTLEALLRVRGLLGVGGNYNKLTLSPDGRYAACVLQHAGAGAFAWRVAIVDLASGETIQLSEPDVHLWGPAWSPKGHGLVCLGSSESRNAYGGAIPRTAHVYVWRPGDPRARPLPGAARGTTGVHWRSDGCRILVPTPPVPPNPDPERASVLVFRAKDAPAPLAPATILSVDVLTGESCPVAVGPEPFGVYPAPRGDAFLWSALPARITFGDPLFYQTLHCHDGDGRDHALVTMRGDHLPVRARWSPDGTRFAVVDDGAVLLWKTTAIGTPTRLFPGAGERARDGALFWTADGSAVVVWDGRRLWRLPVTGDPPGPLELAGHEITGLLHHAASGQLPPGEVLAFTRDRHDRHGIHRLPSGAPVLLAPNGTLLAGQPFSNATAHLSDVTRDGSVFVYAAHGPFHPGDLWVARDGGRTRRQATDLNPHLKDIAVGPHTRFAFRTSGGKEASAGLLLPPGWQPGNPCPTVIKVYPGSFPSETVHHIGSNTVVSNHLLAANGFAVLWADIPYDKGIDAPAAVAAAAVVPAAEEAVRLGYSDPERIAIAGESFGGYAVLATLARTNRFRAALATSGVGDLVSNYGSMHGKDRRSVTDDGDFSVWATENGQFAMGGPPWERPLHYVNNSPIFFLDRIETPLLLIAGAKDPVASWLQWGEVFVGMRRLRKRCTLLLYRDGGHGLATLSEPDQRDAVNRVLAFLTEHLGRPPAG